MDGFNFLSIQLKIIIIIIFICWSPRHISYNMAQDKINNILLFNKIYYIHYREESTYYRKLLYII